MRGFTSKQAHPLGDVSLLLALRGLRFHLLWLSLCFGLICLGFTSEFSPPSQNLSGNLSPKPKESHAQRQCEPKTYETYAEISQISEVSHSRRLTHMVRLRSSWLSPGLGFICFGFPLASVSYVGALHMSFHLHAKTLREPKP